jgi:hypothetical protein
MEENNSIPLLMEMRESLRRIEDRLNKKKQNFIPVMHQPSLLGPNTPSEKDLKYLYDLKFDEKNRFISRTSYEDFREVGMSRDLSIQHKKGIYIQFGCQTRVALKILMRLSQSIWPNACNWNMIGQCQIFRTKKGLVLKKSNASSTASKVKNGTTHLDDQIDAKLKKEGL